jgi:hypothetical protein
MRLDIHSFRLKDGYQRLGAILLSLSLHGFRYSVKQFDKMKLLCARSK